jgi:hypothetical protein
MDQKLKNKTRVCAVASCHNPSGISYHSFPKEAKLQQKWLQACKRSDFVNVKTASVCSRHFLPADFERDLRNELLKQPLRALMKNGKLF